MKKPSSKTYWGLGGVLVTCLLIFSFYAYRSLEAVAVHQAERVLQMPVEISGVDLDILEGSISLLGVKIYHPDKESQLVVQIPRLTIELIDLPFGGDTGWQIELHLDHPRILFVTDRRGEWELSGRVPLLRRGKGAAGLKPFNVEKISMDDGEIEFRDHRVSSPPTVTKISKIRLRLDRLRLPTSEESLPSEFDARFLVGNSGYFQMKGKGDFLSPKTSFDSRLSVRKLSLPPYAPYYSRGLPVRIRKGNANFSTQAKCQKDILNIPFQAKVTGLEVELKKKKALGFASDLAVNSLKNDQGQVEVDLLIKGNLKRPRIVVLTDFNKAVLAGLSQPFKETGSKIKEGTKTGFRKVKGFFRRKK